MSSQAVRDLDKGAKLSLTGWAMYWESSIPLEVFDSMTSPPARGSLELCADRFNS